MNNPTIEDVFRKLKALIKIKTKKDFDSDMVEIFKDALSEFTPEEVLYGIKMCSQTETYGIDPSDIVKHLKPSEEEIDARLEAEVSPAISHCLKDFSQGDWSNPFSIDKYPELNAAFIQVMAKGREYWNDESNLKYFGHEFRKAFKGVAKLPENFKRLELQEAKEKEERLLRYQQGELSE